MSVAASNRVSWFLLAIASMSSCQCADPTFGELEFVCVGDSECAEGFRCANGVCRRLDAGTAGGEGGGAAGGLAGGDAGGSAGGDAGGDAGGTAGGTAGGAAGGTAGGFGAATQLAFAAPLSPTFTRRVALPVQPRILVQDAQGATVADATDTVTLAGYTDAACMTLAAGTTLRPATPLAAVGGVAVFDSVSLDGTAALYVGATAPGLQRACSALVSPGAALFSDQAAALGVRDQGDSSYGWAAFSDVDGDARPDLFFTSDGGVRLFLNATAGAWRPGANPLGPTERAITLGDCDNDGWRDMFGVGGTSGAVTVFRNARDGGFLDVSPDSGLSNPNGEGGGLLDFDRDGLLDYVLPNGNSGGAHLWRNSGGCVFTDATAAAGLPASGLGNGEQVVVVDYDVDGDVDVFYGVAQGLDGGGRLHLFRNEGNGTFADVSAVAGLGAAAGLDYRAGFAFGDYDNDGDFDLFIGRNASRPRGLLRNDGATFTDVTAQSGDLATDTLFEVEGAAFGDFDNDGLLDLYVAADGASDRVFRNVGGGRFITLTQTGFVATGGGRESTGVALADIDLDGDLDAYVNSGGTAPTYFFVNQHGGPGFLKVKVRGQGGAGKYPIDGTGAVVQLFDATGTVLRATREVSGGAAMAQSDAVVHFGLAASWGGATASYVVKVRFNSGLHTRPGVVVPASSSLTVGGTVLPNTVEVVEP